MKKNGTKTEKCEEEKRRGIAAFLENPYWKAVYDNAPEDAKRWYEWCFAWSEADDEHVSDYFSAKGDEEVMNLSDAAISYISRNVDNKYGKRMICDMLRKRGGDGVQLP